jgi:WD40 repeat protein
VGGWQVYSLTGHSGAVWSVAFSPNGNLVASGSRDNLVKIWNAETGALVSSFVGVRWGDELAC